MLAMMKKKFVFFQKADTNIDSQVDVELFLTNRLEQNFFGSSTLAR